jgi:fructose-1,6-bisphosphatase-3
MRERSASRADERRYLALLSEKFPTCQTVYTEIINLEAILNLPKGTEHFMSDVHGEYGAFDHILNNCSGVIRERVKATFRHELTATEQADLCTLIYYPTERIRRLHELGQDTPEWYSTTLLQLIRLARYLSDSYTRSKVRKAMPVAYSYIIDELLHASAGADTDRHAYHVSIIRSIVDTGSAEDFIESLSALVKRLAVDHLHIVGDLYDRGPHADRIIDRLMAYHSLDLQWGNHDICWMGAAAGSAACVATVVRNNVRYGTLEILESSYGISLRELEGQLISRHPEFDMADRLLLDKVDLAQDSLMLDGKAYELRTVDFPTFDADDPYRLTADETAVMEGLVTAFRESDRLRSHVDFLYEKGSMYLAHNGNLLFHGCVPMSESGTFRRVDCAGAHLSGRAYMDWCDRTARRAWHEGDQDSLDWMWYLWCGQDSPLSGRKVKTFERTYLIDKTTWVEPQDPYYTLAMDPATCRHVLEEFGLPRDGHIINGHNPVKAGQGESPVKADGMLMVIDGGFCEAYHRVSGIAGYTLVADSHGMRIKAHRPFSGLEAALDANADIVSDDDQVVTYDKPLTIANTDTGSRIREQISDLGRLLDAYRMGELPEHGDA